MVRLTVIRCKEKVMSVLQINGIKLHLKNSGQCFLKLEFLRVQLLYVDICSPNSEVFS
jgi:hypothetical protein